MNIRYFKSEDIIGISNLHNLNELSLINSKIEMLDEIFEINSLKFLELAYLSKLDNLVGIKQLSQMETLLIESCKELSSWVLEVACLQSLKKLAISKMSTIKSILPFASLNALEELFIIENTKIEDGKISFLEKMPSINKISIQGFKHYDINSFELYKRICDKSGRPYF